MEKRRNFYILLGLEYDPPVTDAGTIKAALHKKKQEWTRWQDNPAKRNTALANLDMVPEMERVMADAALRTREAEAAVKERAELLRQFEAELRILEGKGHILPREATALAQKYSDYGVDREKVVATARCPISEIPLKAVDEDLDGEVLDRITAKTIQRDLALLGYGDLYEFLNEPQYSSVKKLCLSAEQKRRSAAAGGKSGVSTITQELAGICLQLFESFDSKQKYDRYLKIGRYPDLADMIDQEHTRARYLSAGSLLRLVNFAVETYRIGVLEAEELVRRYCVAYRIPIGEQGRESTCPACGGKSGADSFACTRCSQPLRGECPQCGAAFEKGMAVCASCGFAIAEMVQGLKKIREAETALIENDWSTARRCLQHAARYWPNHPKLEALNRRTLRIEERYASYVDGIADCVTHNQYYAALDLVREASARRIALPLSTVRHVEKVVADLEDEIRAIEQSGQPPEFSVILQLAETVADSMELTHLMRRFPPEAPANATSGIHERNVRLTWSISESAGMKDYMVVRRQDAVPLTPYDGDIVYEGPANSFLDDDAQPLCEYYYSIYTRRGGALSPTANTVGPVLIVPEIKSLRILPTDMGAQLSWEYDPAIKEVVLWRKASNERPMAAGEGVKLSNVRLDGYTDSRIKNGVEYWYYVCAVYHVGGRKIYSKGVCDSVMPRPMLAPIDEMLVLAADDGEDEYVASWQASHFSDVLLFASTQLPLCQKGDMALLSDLIADYRKLDLLAKQPASVRFRHAWNGGLYIFPAAVTGKFATVGEIQYLTHVRDVKEPTFDLIDGDLFLNMKWPTALAEIVITYRFDQYAEAPDEIGATTVRCSREEYDYNAGVKIRDAEPATYYITIFSVFATPEGDEVYSPGVRIFVDNTEKLEVAYKFSRSKRLFSNTQLISVSIQSDLPFALPKSVIVGKVGRLPLSRNDGIPLFEIDKEARVDGSVVYEYRASSLPDHLYIRLFFNDEERYEKLRLLPLDGLRIT